MGDEPKLSDPVLAVRSLLQRYSAIGSRRASFDEFLSILNACCTLSESHPFLLSSANLRRTFRNSRAEIERVPAETTILLTREQWKIL